MVKNTNSAAITTIPTTNKNFVVSEGTRSGTPQPGQRNHSCTSAGGFSISYLQLGQYGIPPRYHICGIRVPARRYPTHAFILLACPPLPF